jgi:hypothetical protein
LNLNKSRIHRTIIAFFFLLGAFSNSSGTDAPQLPDSITATQEHIQSVVTKASANIKKVYEHWLKKDASLHGTIQIRFSIDSLAHPDSISVVESTTRNSPFDQAVMKALLAGLVFDPTIIKHRLEISLPFSFTANDDRSTAHRGRYATIGVLISIGLIAAVVILVSSFSSH